MEPINLLNCPFLSAEQIQTLASRNIKNLIDLIKAPSEVVCKALEITVSEYSIIRQSVLRYAQKEPISLRQLAMSKMAIPRSTGFGGFDKMLGGGILPGDIIEFYGKSGSGKSLLCLYLVSQFCHFADDGSCALYFDMKNDFNVSRLYNFCCKTKESLARVNVFRVPHLEGLMSQLDVIKNQAIGNINGFYSQVRFLVIDSVPMVIYPAVERGHYSWRYHQEALLEKLAWLANHLQLAVVLVNHAVTTRPGVKSSGSSGSSASQSQPTIKPAMGKYWFHKINIRIYLTKSDGYLIACLEKSGRSSEGNKFKFRLKSDGMLDFFHCID